MPDELERLSEEDLHSQTLLTLIQLCEQRFHDHPALYGTLLHIFKHHSLQ